MPPKDRNTEQTILDAAKRIFVRKGFAVAKMEDIAQEAGINRALLNYYFRSKDRLFDKIHEEIEDMMFAKMMEALPAGSSVEQHIRHFVESFTDLHLDHPYLAQFIVHELNINTERFFERVTKRHNQKPPVEFMNAYMQDYMAGKVKALNPALLMMNMISLCVFPFVARPLFMAMFSINDEQYVALLRERKEFVIQTILASIRA
jgi:TetR/AcrR family transcriptional regulator